MKDIIVKGTCAEDIRRAKKEGKRALMWNIQDTISLGGGEDAERELETLDLYYSLGIRCVQLTYNLRNFVGDGCTERYQSGLTHFGLEVVDRLNQLGMLVDVSHCGFQTTLDAVEASRDPVAATLTGCKGVYFHSRNKADEELKAVAEKDGYVGIVRESAFLGGRGTIKEVLDHIDYAVDLIGVNHVGIGSDRGYSALNMHQSLMDKLVEEERKQRSGSSSAKRSFSWSGWRPEEPTANAEMTPKMVPFEMSWGSLAWINWPYYTVGLVSRGYSDQEIQKIIGGNFMTILERVIG